MKTYAAINNDIRTREQSSSGGIFSLFASKFDVVYGAAFTEECYSCEIVRTEKDISSLRGSKYLQAHVGNSYLQAKDDLLNGKRVLFTGTGCQINGLLSFLGKEYEDLITVDVICHGTPSPKLWKKYLIFQEEFTGKITSVNFRCKDNGWEDFGIKENNTYISKDDDAYMRMFLRNYSLRPSCYSCNAKQNKKSDISMADFWGIEDVIPEFNDESGTSLIIARTSKGEKLFESIKSQISYREVSYEDGVRNNTAEFKSVEKPEQRIDFYKDLDNLSFDEFRNKYASDIEISLKDKTLDIVVGAVAKLKKLFKQ